MVRESYASVRLSSMSTVAHLQAFVGPVWHVVSLLCAFSSEETVV